jgi:aspartyl protease family protein
MTSGTKSLLSEIAGWAFCAFVIVGGMTHFDEIRFLTRQLSGAPPAELLASQEKPGQEDPEGEANSAGGTVQLKAGPNGHFHVEAEINGRSVGVLVDTGATMVALRYEDAEEAGIYLDRSDFTQGVSTANGIARVAPVTLERVSIGDITVRNVPAAVAERGKLQTTLLGMSFLGRLERVDMRSGTLVLQE